MARSIGALRRESYLPTLLEQLRREAVRADAAGEELRTRAQLADLERELAQARQELAEAQAAARALLQNTKLEAREIVQKGLSIAADICVYTNHNLIIEELDAVN